MIKCIEVLFKIRNGGTLMKLALIGTGKIIEDALFAMEPVKTIERTAVFARPHSRDKAEKLAKQTDADGGILFAHWGCKGTIGASGLIKNVLETAGLPTMILDGDGCNPANTSDGQVSTRLQAFAEMLEKNKEEKHS